MTDHVRDRIAASFERELARSPMPPGLRAKALGETVPSERDLMGRRRPRAAGPWVAGLRGVGSLVAVLLVVVLIATVLAGGQVWRDWNRFNSRPAPAPAGGIDPAQVAQLRETPLHLPLFQPGATCPTGPLTTITYGGGPWDMFGTGPVYAIQTGPWYPSQWGWYWDMKVFVDPGYTGPVLIRARNLAGGPPLVFVGQYASGDVVGTDSIAGKKFQQHLELVLDPRQPPFDTTPSGMGGWKIRAGQPNDPGATIQCAGFQVDGFGFSEVFVTLVVYGG